MVTACGLTKSFLLDVRVPAAVKTDTEPLVAPFGIVAVR
jgi:hypothetical protein